MRVALIQMMVTADKVGNINTACEKLREAAVNGADIAVLPEMFCCPYQNDCFRTYGEEENGPAQAALSALAAELGIYVVGGSLPELFAGGVDIFRFIRRYRHLNERDTHGVSLLNIFPQHELRGAAVRGEKQPLYLGMAAVFRLDEVPQGGAAVAAVDEPDAVGPGSRPPQQGVHRHFGLICCFAVEVRCDDGFFHLLTSFQPHCTTG